MQGRGQPDIGHSGPVAQLAPSTPLSTEAISILQVMRQAYGEGALDALFQQLEASQDASACGYLQRAAGALIKYHLREGGDSPARDELLSLTDHSLAEAYAQTPPLDWASTITEGMLDGPDEETRALRRHFYQAEFRAREHETLFACLQEFEALVTKSWEPASSGLAWHGRYMPVLQSSGVGKSRLVRQLAKVQQGKAVTVFLLCLRPGEYELRPRQDAPFHQLPTHPNRDIPP